MFEPPLSVSWSQYELIKKCELFLVDGRRKMLISKYNKIRLRSDRHPKKNVKENFFVIIF